MNARFAFVLIVAVLVVASPLRAETTEQWIAKARAYLGSESALNSVSTIRYTGGLEETTALAVTSEVKTEGAVQKEMQPLEIVFQKPCQQLMAVTRSNSIDTMVLDDYEGWSKSTARSNPKQWAVNLLDVGQIKQLRANTWENLSFFAGLEKNGGRVELGSDVTVDGVLCAKLSFVHSDWIVFHRYFDKTSGRLVKTVTADGSEIREEGEMIVGGIRFPKKIINKKATTGQVTTIIFETVVLNERVSPADFAVPSLYSN